VNQKHELILRTKGGRRFGLSVAVLAMLGSSLHADINISFSSRVDSTNEQSDGSPLDTSFTFELGSFSNSFTPMADNTDQWLINWTPAPNSNTDPSSGPTVSYTQTSLPSFIAPDTGMSNNFSGSITLNTNSSPFGPTDLGYIWGYDDRDGVGTGEWVLISNPSWLYPTVVPGPQLGGPDWQVSDSGTFAVDGIGSVNPTYSGLGDAPLLVTSSVILAPAIPEPATAVLLAGALGLLLIRRRP
jgi:hypothetical protein